MSRRTGREEAEETSSFLGGFIFGMVAGAIAAVLFAPRSGEEMRENLRQRGAEMRESGAERVQNAHVPRPSKESFTNAKDSVTNRARIVLDNGKERLDSYRQSNGSDGTA